MSHKKVSRLVELTAPEIQTNDLFYIVDVSATEGKKLQVTSLAAYLNSSGSLYAIHALTADTASYILGSNVYGLVESSSYSLFSNASISSSWATRSFSASYAETASFAMNSVGGSTVSSSWANRAGSSSWADRSGIALTANVASSLVWPNTSTASYAMANQSSSYAKTASYVNEGTTSYAHRAGWTSLSDTSTVTNNLVYPNVSTASYAMTAANFVYNHYIDYGVSVATSQSITCSQLDLVVVSSSMGTARNTSIDAYGTVTIPYTSSVAVNESLRLIVKNRDTGIETVIDTTPVYVYISRTVNNWNDLMSGSIKIPYSLMGSSSMLGNYMVFVSGSSTNIQIDSNRVNRFHLASLSDSLTVSVYEEPLFNLTVLVPPALLAFSSSVAGTFFDSRDGMLSSGSSNVYYLNISSSDVTSLRYVWSLSNLRSLDCSGNPMLTTLAGMPDTLETMSCQSCSISSMVSLENTTMSYFNIGANSLTALPVMPETMSYLNCSNNNITSLLNVLPLTASYLNCSDNLIANMPPSLPGNLTELWMGSNGLTSIAVTLPTSLLTMSAYNNTSLGTIASSIPQSLGWIDVSYTSLTSLPTLPSGSLIYLNATSCSLSSVAMTNICSQLSSSNVTSGSLLMRGNGPITTATETTYVYDLRMFLSWSVEYDYSV